MTILARADPTVIDALVTATIVASFLALAIVGWIFWRAARRDRREAERERGARREPPPS